MMVRRNVFPAEYQTVIDAALDAVQAKVKAGTVPAFARDRQTGFITIEVHLIRTPPLPEQGRRAKRRSRKLVGRGPR